MSHEIGNLTRRAVLAGALSGAVAGSQAWPKARAGGPRGQKSFLWGVATAGHQIEGNNVNSDYWVMENVKPTLFAERSGDACDSYHRFAEDIGLIAAAGLNTYRFSLEWARIEPNEGQFSEASLDYYLRVVDCCHAKGIRPVVTFNHYTTPAWFAASGGWLRADAPQIFARFCDRAARKIARGIEFACTLNEPQVDRLLRGQSFAASLLAAKTKMQAAAARRMGSDRFEPYLTVMDSDQYLQPLIAAHDAGFAAIKAARSDLPVGVTLAVVDFQASEPGTRIDEIRYDTYAAWMEAARRNCDFVGVQNYNREVIGPNGTVTPAKEAEKDFLGREVYPEALGNAVRYIHEGTGKPILITENGIVTNDDTQRVRYIDGAIASMRRVMTEGVPVLGYIHWSLLDNFEWLLGFHLHFGLVAVDRKTFARTPKPSLAHLGRIARKNQLV